MYNHISQIQHLQMMDGDVMVALHYLRGKADCEHEFFFKYTIDIEG